MWIPPLMHMNYLHPLTNWAQKMLYYKHCSCSMEEINTIKFGQREMHDIVKVSSHKDEFVLYMNVPLVHPT